MNKKKTKNRLLFILTLIILCSAACTSTDTDETDSKLKDRIKNEETVSKKEFEEKIKSDAENNTLAEQTIEPLKVPNNSSISKELIKTVQQKENKEESVTPEKPFYDYFLKRSKKTGLSRVSIAFDAAPIGDVIPIFAKILTFNYLIDPEVSGVVTMSIDSELDQKDLWQLFQQILWLTGSYCSLDDQLLHILPFNKMPKERQLLSNTTPHANVSVVLFPIKNANSTEILEKITPFLTEGAMAMNISNQNAVLVVEAPTNISKIRTLIKELDIKNKFHWPQAIIKCVKIPASRAVEELFSILPVLGFPVSIDNSSDEPGAIELQAIDRLQLIIASAANKEALTELKKWIHILDRTDVGEQEQVYVYNIINAKAEELVKALSVIFLVEGDTLNTTSSNTSSSSTMMASAFNTTEKQPGQSNNNNKEQTPVSIFEVPVKIFADAINNRLIFRTTPRTYAMIKALLDKIDTVPSQVLLQIVIAEIHLTSSTNFGVEFQQKMGQTGLTNTIGTQYPTLHPAAGDDAGFQYTISGGNSELYIRALAEKGDTKLLARPQILVESHTEALVSVGESIPIVTNEQNAGTTDPTTGELIYTKSYEYKETGIILKITPHVTKGGLITADIDQTISTPIQTTSSSIQSPTIRVRQLVTTLSFPDKSTIIIGGLIQNKSNSGQATLPLIGNIPILAELVGSNDISKERTELLLIITGTVVDRETKLEKMLESYRRSTEFMEKMESEDNVNNNITLEDENVNNILIK